MYKSCNVVMLSTNEKAEIGMINLEPYNREGFKLELIHYVTNGDGLNQQHLYITSNDEIKEGSLFIANQGIFRCLEVVKGNYPYKSCLVEDKKNIQFHSKHWNNNVIATTNNNISINLGKEKHISPIDNRGDMIYTRLCPLSQIPQQFIEHYVSEYNKGNVITEVMVEFDRKCNKCNCESQSETYPNCIWSDCVAKNKYKSKMIETLKLNQDNTINIKTVKDSWNIKEIEEIHVSVVKQGCLYESGTWSNEHERLVRLEFNKYVEQNL